ncbi:hypothetical protein CFP56_029045 [Quercus suber]|uniref:Uncharacterized protein n=1 Tax=Quercus suber TaxID=58331 RepID=A0AAW0JS16_QUESU|nr:hypothetical protein CFP56_35395 [Quercus suber]
MGVGFEASKKVTGGEWHRDGKLDVLFVSALKILCLRSIRKIHQILGALVEKMTNDGQGVPIGKICYRTRDEKLAKTNVMVSIPCGVCPRCSD